MTIEKKIDELKQKTKSAELGGGEARIERQHKAGKLTARERVNLLLDENIKAVRFGAKITNAFKELIESGFSGVRADKVSEIIDDVEHPCGLLILSRKPLGVVIVFLYVFLSRIISSLKSFGSG